MWAGNSGNDNNTGSLKPCLSGVGLLFKIPDQNNAATVNDLRKLNDLGGTTIKTADGSTISNAYHIAFKNFITNSSATNVTLSAVSGTATPYTFNLAPDHEAVFGGNGVLVDLLVDGDSTIVLDLGFFLGLFCGQVGGSGGSTCTVKVSTMNAGFVAFAGSLGISTFTIRKMDLKIYYVVTHTAAGGIPTGASLQFPDTSITVGGS